MAHGNSKIVTTNQAGIHDNLDDIVAKHLTTEFKKPIQEHTQRAFEEALAWFEKLDKPLILDSGCGVGESTANIASEFPDHAIIGIDKSELRVTKHDKHYGGDLGNYLLVRADLIDFWRLCLKHNLLPEKHFILYPNPYPKSVHVKRRWHASPVFPTLCAFGGQLEMRSNWKLYLDEFAYALSLTKRQGHVHELHIDKPMTPFERKYRDSGQALWKLTASLNEH